MHLKTDDSFDRRSVMLMLASVVLFAANTLLIRAVSQHIPAVDGWLATIFRGGIGLLVVFALYGRGRGLEPKRLFTGRLITIRGIVGALSIIAFYITIVKLGAARAVILNLTYPIFATIIAAIWLKEKISRAAMLWMVVGFCGLVVFLSGHGQLLRPSPYDLLALAGAVGAGCVVVIIRRLRHEEHPATIYASQAFYSLVIAAPSAMKLPGLPVSAWCGLAAGAVIVTFAQLVMTRAYQFMSVSRGSSLQMLLPLTTAVGGYAFFGESFHPVEIAGALLTLLATWRVVVSR
ncbi:MAG: DMT family transporter [Luteolibacter sp.]|uniref:DMT family transporter n=1 Tax=Luteolibacter sp. TaxID=1962973 RepID=UPI003266AC24